MKLAFVFMFGTTFLFGQGTVVLTVTGIDLQKGGEISAGIFTKENFPTVGKAMKQAVAKVVAVKMELTLANIPPGEYGIAVFQDADRNKKLKSNFVGFPQEPIGFSNDARIKLGPPSFDDARITVTNGQTTRATIILR
jgi:uncharacterized protein (DUF2141 family)